MKFNKLFLTAIAGSLFLASCNSDDDSNAPLGSYDNGVLVLNEGGLGTVTYISDDMQTVQQDIFSAVNGADSDIGAYTQSIFFADNRAFIISNGSNKITVVNRYTFEKVGEITTSLTVPRYGVVYDGKAYVTNSNTFESSTDDFITVINLNTLAVETTIPVNNQAERLIEENGKLYVSGGFYGAGHVVTVINTSNNQIVTTIEVGEAPNSLEERDGMLYVLCGSWSGASKLVKIQLSNNQIAGEVTFPDTMGNAQNLDIDGGLAYFTVGPKIYKINVGATSVTDTAFIETGSDSDYIGYGFAVEDGRIYISEAAEDFTSDGKIFIYAENNGALLDEIPVGLGPNGFYFN
ncbi:hypothetical protein HUK80_13890 [Flavobacterium sp. MAH-1]|uniref:40-residue YVTN family beta-propeller repeat-containing protein n=1 Tax=Flavobacterium agri TaxID=2743471 RepID=A0A7Y9C6F2_9FLAO|nr:DUF5074 domain-containing protein [Flavobacterium agri]NUY81991.1 hypothetical protein [Flavobacterium agri]NYA72015.1 hypothetical protein [Flavobacterium agri]